MKRTLSILLILLLTVSVVSATTISEKPRELNKTHYFFITKIKQPFESFVSLFTKEDVRLEHIQEKQEILKQVTYFNDKEKLLDELDVDIEKVEKDADSLTLSGLSIIKEELRKERQELKDNTKTERLLELLKERLQEREQSQEYLNNAERLFPNKILLITPDNTYTLFFGAGKYKGYEEGTSANTDTSIRLSPSQVNELVNALETREYNRFDSTLADALPPQLKLRMKDMLKERFMEGIKEKDGE